VKILGVFFLFPKWLFACAAIPFLYLAGRWLLEARRRRFMRFAEEPVWSRIAPDLDWTKPRKKLLVWCLSILFVLLALARPQWGESEEVMKTTGLDVMLVVDVSQSMLAEDVVPNRLKKAQHFIRRFLERSQGDRVGLVAFAGNSTLLSPLTTDLDYVGETVDTLGTDSTTAQGTDLGAGLETALNALERGAEDNSGKETQAPVSRAIVLVSDGEDNEDRIKEAVEKLKKENLRLFVFGIGTEKGGPIPVRNPDGQTVGFKRDSSGQPVVTRFVPDSLRKLASDSGGRFWALTPSENELDELASELGSLSRGEFAEKRVTIRKERFQIPLAVAIALLFLELAVPARRTSAVASLLALLAIGLSSPEAAADELRAHRLNEKAIQAFQEDRVSEAKELFGDAQVEAPGAPELRFNQGAIHLKEEKWDQASQVYGESAAAAQKAQNPGLAALSLYDQGVARTAKKDLEGAARSYLDALEQNAKAPDPRLEAMIRKNLELLFQQQQQQQQGKGGKSDEEQDQDKKDKSDEGESGKNSSDGDKEKKDDKKDGDEKKDQPKKYKESNGKREFKSQKLSPEDANRVMSELARREKELQDKRKKAQGRPQGLEKDW
jgi:Ca-activated chloride channel family protein